jgi:hypothetical protein
LLGRSSSGCWWIRLLEAERARSEGLLRNMLPESIAERLKQRQEVIADASRQVTVLFTDIVDFTSHAERSPPEARGCLHGGRWPAQSKAGPRQGGGRAGPGDA